MVIDAGKPEVFERPGAERVCDPTLGVARRRPAPLATPSSSARNSATLIVMARFR